MIRIRFLLGHGIIALLLLGFLYPAIVFADLQGWSAAVARKDYATANRELRPLAEKGNARAQFELGIVYQYGLGVDANYTEAADWFQKAANQNYVLAQLNLGTMYVEGQGVPQDYKKGRVLLTAAAEEGNEYAAMNLGKMFENGNGVDRNDAEAFRWYRVAADQNDPIGEHRVGTFYWVGQGAPLDATVSRSGRTGIAGRPEQDVLPRRWHVPRQSAGLLLVALVTEEIGRCPLSATHAGGRSSFMQGTYP